MTLFRGLLLLAALMLVVAFIVTLSDHFSAQSCIESGGILQQSGPGRMWLCYHDGRVSIQ